MSSRGRNPARHSSGGAGARLAGYLVCGLLAAAAGAASDPLDEARALHRDGRWPEALAAYRAVAAESSDPATAAIAHNNACHVLINMADHTAALDECHAALAARRGLGDERGVARTLTNLGLALRHLGRYDEAAIAYHESLAINERRGDVQAQLRNLSNLGVLAAATGSYGDAMGFHSAAEKLAAGDAAEPWSARQIRIARLNQGVVLEKLGAYREALDLYRALAAETDESDPEPWALIQVNLGVIYRNLGDPVQAVAAFAAAAETYTRLGDAAALSNARLNQALALHLNLGRHTEAEDAYRDALDLARAAGDRTEEIQDLFYLGNLQLEIGRLEAAEASFRSCLELAAESGSPEGRWSSLYGLGRVAEARGSPGDALDLFRRAMDEIEQVRSSLGDAARRLGYFGDKRPVYAAAVRVLAALDGEEPGRGRSDEALAVVQRAKARQLLDSLGSPRLAAEPVQDAAALRLLSGPGEVLLEYFRGGDDLYMWVIRRDGIRMANLGAAGPIFERVREVHSALTAGREGDRDAIAALSRALLGGVESLDAATSLRIAPDGTLFYLPFEILPFPGAPGEILLDRLAISYLPSASTLALLARRREAEGVGAAPDPLRLAAFANPELPADPANPMAPANLLLSRYEFGPLPAAEKELVAVGRILRGEQELRVGRDATEGAFRRAALRGSRVIHLATHTLVDERPGQGSVIVLAAGEGHDGLLYPEEIAALEYRADLTVLASCRSALGAIESGRALASLTGAFLAAGSSAVVATLWEIDDAAAAAFMEQFYHQLAGGHDAAAALRRAKSRLRADSNWDRPSLWAAYVLIGEGPSLGGARVPIWAWALAILLMLAGLGYGLTTVQLKKSPDSNPSAKI